MSGNPASSSKDFDLTLLICLLRNIVGIPPPLTRRWDLMPIPNDKSAGAYLVRLRVYRNELAHATQTTMSVNEFDDKLLKITEAVSFFDGGQASTILPDILTFDLDGSESAENINHLSIQINQIKQEYETELKEANAKVEQMESELKFHLEGSLPKNISDCIYVTVKQWKKNDVTFFETQAAKSVIQTVMKEKTITIIGDSGSGKTALARHIALHFATEYQIVPIVDPDELLRYRCKTVKQIFVFDDVVGKYSISLSSLDKWERLQEMINTLFQNNETHSREDEHSETNTLSEDKAEPEDVMLVCTLRRHIAENKQFKISTSVTVLNQNIFAVDNLSFAEKQSILWNHLIYTEKHEHMNETVFNSVCKVHTCISFPLLCQLFTTNQERFEQGINFFEKPMDIVQEEISKLYFKNKEVYCALVICSVLGRLDANIFNVSQQTDPLRFNFHFPPKQIVELVAEACGLHRDISRQALLDSIVSVEGTFVFGYSNNEFEFIHDFHREVIITHFLRINFSAFITIYDIDFLSKVLAVDKNYSTGSSQDESKIFVRQQNFVDLSRRFIFEIKNKNFYPIFASEPMKHEHFVNILGTVISDEECREDLLRVKCTPTYGFPKRSVMPQDTFCMDAIEYMTSGPGSDSTLFSWILVTGCQPFFLYFWQNMTDTEKKQHICQNTLCYAVLGGNCKIIETLIKAGAPVNQAFENGLTPLSIAVRLKNDDIVSLLLRLGGKVCKREQGTRMTPINIAATKGWAAMIDLLLHRSRQKVQCTTNHTLPLDKNKIILKQSTRLPRDKKLIIYQTTLKPILYTVWIDILMTIEVLPCRVYLPDIDIPNADGNTPLHSAVLSRDIKSVYKLLEYGANPCLRNDDEYTASDLSSNLSIPYGTIEHLNLFKKGYPLYFIALILCFTLCLVFLSIPYFLFEVKENRGFGDKEFQYRNSIVIYGEETRMCMKESITKFEYYEFLLLFYISITIGINNVMLLVAKTYNLRGKYKRYVLILGCFYICRIICFYWSFFSLLYNTSSLLLIASDHIYYLILLYVEFYLLVYIPPCSLFLMFNEYRATKIIWNPQVIFVTNPIKYKFLDPTYGLKIKYLLTCPIFEKHDLENIESTYTSNWIFFLLTFMCMSVGIMCFIHVIPAILLVKFRKSKFKWLSVSVIFSLIFLISVVLLFGYLELPCRGRHIDMISFILTKYDGVRVCQHDVCYVRFLILVCTPVCNLEYFPVPYGKINWLNPLFMLYDNPKYEQSEVYNV